MEQGTAPVPGSQPHGGEIWRVFSLRVGVGKSHAAATIPGRHTEAGWVTTAALTSSPSNCATQHTP